MGQRQEKSYDAWVGVDVSKETLEAGVVVGHEEVQLRELRLESFARTKAGSAEVLRWAEECAASRMQGVEERPRLLVVMEATGRYSLELAAWLLTVSPSVRLAIINPAQAKAYQQSLGVRNKTDQVDARCLALYGRERNPRPYVPPSPELAELQALSRQRDVLLSTLVAERQRARNSSPSKLLTRIQKDHIRYLEHQIHKIEEAMEQVVARSEQLTRDVELLDSIPGVGRKTAIVILAELGDLRRFERARQVSAFAGLSPRKHQSGTSIHKRTRLCKQGNPRIRTALYMATLSIIGRNNPLASYYQALVEKGKAKPAAMGAVMRKMLVLMRALVRSATPYQSDYYNSRQSLAKGCA